jgi:hypothetical protein
VAGKGGRAGTTAFRSPGAGRWKGRLGGRFLDLLEVAVTSGLIVLALLAVLAGFLWTRLRKRIGLSVTGKQWTAAVVIFALVVLALWANAH